MKAISDNIFYNSLNQLTIGIIIISHEYEIIFYNEWVSEHSGILAGEVIGKKISTVFTSFTDSRLEEACDAALTLGLPTKLSNTFNPKPFPFYAKNHIGDKNHHLHQQVSVKSISSFDNKNLCEIIIDNVSSTVKKEQMLKKLADENKHQQIKAEIANIAKSQFLANMSHEIRTPMNGVLGMLDLLSTTSLTKEQQYFSKLAKTSADTLLNLISDILDFSKIEAGKLEIELIDFDLRSHLGDLAQALSIKSKEKGIEVILDDVAVKQQMVIGDPGRLRQIITNLVSNAIKFTPSGEIIIKASLSPSSLKNEGFNLHVIVSDTGIGIAPNKCETLFDAFTQVDASTTREYGGTGLGLSIAKQLCQLMAGDIKVSSTVGVGSEFSFTIELGQSTKELVSLPIKNVSGMRALLVDDNKMNRQVISDQLTLWGVETVEAASREAAIKLLNEHSGDYFSVAFIDMHMPNMSGDMLCQEIKSNRQFSTLKLVMLTSVGKRGDALYLADLGFSAYLIKPVKVADLYNTLEIIIDNGQILEKATPLITKHFISSVNKVANINHGKILLVEDNRINQQVALNVLNRLGFSVEIAENGLEAIEALKMTNENKFFELVLMDCQMPKMDGYQATKAIRNCDDGSINSNIPIIAMTGNAMVGDKEKCLAAGMNDYLTKPINYKLVEQTINFWLKQSEGHNLAQIKI